MSGNKIWLNFCITLFGVIFRLTGFGIQLYV